MNYLDIIILCLVAIPVINDVRKGFIISLASLIALILGIYAAVYFSNYIEVVSKDNFHLSNTWLSILSFTITFLIIVIIVMLLAKALEKVVDIVGMGFLNHLFGAIFGLIKGILLVSVLLFIITSFDSKEKLIKQKVKQESMFYGYVDKVFPLMMKIFGGEINFPAFEKK